MTRNLRYRDSATSQSQTVPSERLHAHKGTILIGNTSIPLQRLQQKTIILLSVIRSIFEVLLVLPETRAFNTETHNK